MDIQNLPQMSESLINHIHKGGVFNPFFSVNVIYISVIQLKSRLWLQLDFAEE